MGELGTLPSCLHNITQALLSAAPRCDEVVADQIAVLTGQPMCEVDTERSRNHVMFLELIIYDVSTSVCLHKVPTAVLGHDE